jgi:hypothetical protein
MAKHAWDDFDAAPYFALVKDGETVTVAELMGCYPHGTPFVTENGQRIKPTDLVVVDDRIKVIQGHTHADTISSLAEDENALCDGLNAVLIDAGITPGDDLNGEEFSYAAAFRTIVEQRDRVIPLFRELLDWFDQTAARDPDGQSALLTEGRAMLRELDDGTSSPFFSWTCPCCKHSILNPHSIPSRGHTWLMGITVLGPEGVIVQGYYNGQGVVVSDFLSSAEFKIPSVLPDDIRVVHTACWEAMDKPATADLPLSAPADDRGFFIDSKAHELTLPQEAYDVRCLAGLRQAT